MSYSEKIRMIRQQKKWSREKLAEEAGISFNTVYNHEHARLKHGGHKSTQKLIAEALGTTLDILNEPSDRLFP